MSSRRVDDRSLEQSELEKDQAIADLDQRIADHEQARNGQEPPSTEENQQQN
jgi:hypothetical protein